MPIATDAHSSLTATIGLHASASTWVFNVVRELLIAAHGDDRVLSFYADELSTLSEAGAPDGRHVVIKSHHGSAGLDAWLAAEQARIVLTVRDPRDASVSMTQRFKTPLKHTAAWLANDCARMMRLAALGHPLMRYEDRFFDDKASIERLSRVLGVDSPPSVVTAIFDRYNTDAVRAFARSLPDLPPERIAMVGRFRMDRVTQILGPHIGDTSEGKWLELPYAVQTELTTLFGPFLDQFGYER